VGYNRSDDTEKDRFAGKFREGKKLIEETQKEGLTDKVIVGGITDSRSTFPKTTTDSDSYSARHVGEDDVQLDNGELPVTYDAIEPRNTGALVFVTESGQKTSFDVTSDDVGRLLEVAVQEVVMDETGLAENEIVLYKK
jgi:hypothetical protein